MKLRYASLVSKLALLDSSIVNLTSLEEDSLSSTDFFFLVCHVIKDVLSDLCVHEPHG